MDHPIRTVTLTILALAASAVGCSHEEPKPGYAMAFSDVERFAKEFDDPRRDEWQRPDEVIAALHLTPDAKVLDLGSGTGYFTVKLARFLEHGRVYGQDTEPRMTAYLEARAKNESLANIRALTVPTSGQKTPELVDAVLVVDTYHHMDDRVAYFTALRSSLKPNALVAIVDFKLDAPVGPPVAHRVTAEAVKAELGAAGFILASTTELPYQFMLVFRSGSVPPATGSPAPSAAAAE
ncbi:hypothetical protein BH09MYX1_BH09MYX1_50970 [soil metagenome]